MRIGKSIELPVVGAIGFAAAGFWVFAELADEITELHEVDRTLLLALRDAVDPALPWGPDWLAAMARDFTALGSLGVLTLVSLASVAFLLMAARRHAAIAVLLAVAGGQAISFALKAGFDRARPDLVPHAVAVYDASFPSGHALMAAVTYLTLGALLAGMQRRAALKLFFLGIAALLALLVGVSRVYLGVHWPSDVAAGWALGAAWAALCWLAMRWLQRRGAVEPPAGEGAAGEQNALSKP